MSDKKTQAEREVLSYLRRIVAGGYQAINSYEEPICWYCRVNNNGRGTKHKPDCLFVHTRRLVQKYSRSHV